MIKILKKIDYVILILILLFILALYGVFQIKIQKHGYVNYFGYTFFQVITGSMEPTIKVKDIVVEKETLPTNIKKELLSKLDNILTKAKDYLEPVVINEYDMVELLVEEERYAKFGIHKGDTGCVMDNKAVQNYIEVDFSGIDENGNFYGDCISVKIDDLKVIT